MPILWVLTFDAVFVELSIQMYPTTKILTTIFRLDLCYFEGGWIIARVARKMMFIG